MEYFSCKTRIISGTGAIWKLGELKIRNLLIVADPYFEKTDIPTNVIRAAGAEQTTCFYDISPDPSVELAARGTALVQQIQPDTVIALGGGSAIDCAKAMVYFSGQKPRLVAIPTTSGSGSEVTDFAILTHNGVKHPLVDDAILPDVAILDGNLLDSLPPSLIADTGFDILTHAVESFVAQGAGAITDALARDAFAAAFTALPASFRGDTRVRQRIHIAATMAGMAFSQAGLGLCHSMSHVLGAQLHLPHGRLNAILLPAVMDANRAANHRYAALSQGVGLGSAAELLAVRNLRNGLIKLRKELGMPGTLQEAGADCNLSRQQRQKICEAVLSDPCCASNPVPVTERMVLEVLEAVTGRG
ncbi:MAG: iron-containing alcohol dehydrogenase [Oscillospiraceae bacterium]|nr:iron-containing alcohol dehydrogenase [Oscillospiraceae bacterium]